jgi:SlyX protein
MEDSQDIIVQRLNELEVKASFADDLLEQLNDVVHRQQLQIDRLAQQLMQLRQQAEDPESGTFRSLRDELPPHY